MEEAQKTVEAPTLPNEMKPPRSGGWGAIQSRIQRSLLLRIALTGSLLLITLLALAPAFLYFRHPHPLLTATKQGDIVLTVSAQGSVQATVYSASFAVPGTLIQVDVVPGQRVHAGDTLASLDTTAAKAAVSGAQTTLADAQNAVSAAQTEVSDAQTALTSAQTSLAEQQSYVSTACGAQPPNATACAAAQAAQARAQAQVDAATARVGASQTRQALTQIALDNAQSALKAAQTDLAATTLIAPHDGIALAVNGQVGDQIAPNSTPFITVADTAQPLATALVSYRDIMAVEPGEPATLRVAQEAGSPPLTGTVLGFELSPQGSGDHLAYPVTIRIDPASLKGAQLLPGMSASAVITTRARRGVVTLPESVIVYTRQAAPASGKGLLTAAQIKTALETAKTLESQAVAGGLDIAHDPPTPSYLIGFAHGGYIAIPVVLGLTDGRQREIIAGLSNGQQVVSGQRNPFIG